MKIAFIVQDLVGLGVQYATAAMARAFHDHGYEVDVLVSRVHADLVASGKRPFELPEGVRVIHMSSRRSSRNVFNVRRYLRTGGADCVICESGHYSFVARVAMIGLWRCPRVFQVCHGNIGELPRSWGTRLRLRLARRWRYSRFAGLMTVNDLARRRMVAQCPWLRDGFVTTVYNPVVDEVFSRKVSQSATHPWLLDKKCPTFVTAGACSPIKGHMMLMEAIRKVNETRPVRLIIFGRGVLESQYRDYIVGNHLEDVISVPGFAESLPAEERVADGFLCGSLSESFSIVLVEALASGCPVISTDAPDGPREVLENGKYGILVPVNDSVAMARAILAFLDAPRLQIPPEAWNRFTVEKIFERYRFAMSL